MSSGRLLASREGIPVILAGTIDRSGSGYKIAVRAITTDKPDPLTVAEATAADKVQVLGAVAKVAEQVREALGDTTIGGAQAETFTAGTLDAVREYTIAQDLTFTQRDSEAVEHYRAALQHDKEFGRAYSGLSASLLHLGRLEEAQKAWDEALRRIDRMTEREKLRVFVTGASCRRTSGSPGEKATSTESGKSHGRCADSSSQISSEMCREFDVTIAFPSGEIAKG